MKSRSRTSQARSSKPPFSLGCVRACGGMWCWWKFIQTTSCPTQGPITTINRRRAHGAGPRPDGLVLTAHQNTRSQSWRSGSWENPTGPDWTCRCLHMAAVWFGFSVLHWSRTLRYWYFNISVFCCFQFSSVTDWTLHWFWFTVSLTAHL